MTDLSSKSDREILEAIYHGLFDKARLGESAKDDDAPDQFEPVEGVEKILGPEPHPSKATDGSVWRTEAKKITKVYQDIPADFDAGALELAARTGVKAVFLEYLGETKACLRSGLSPWLTDAANFVGGNIEGVIRAVKDAK